MDILSELNFMMMMMMTTIIRKRVSQSQICNIVYS